MLESTAKEFLIDSNPFLSIEKINTPNLNKELKIGLHGKNIGHLLPINIHLRINNLNLIIPIIVRLISTNLGSNINPVSLSLRLLYQSTIRVSAALSTHKFKELVKSIT